MGRMRRPRLGKAREREQGGILRDSAGNRGNATKPLSMRAYSRHQVGGGHRGAGSVSIPVVACLLGSVLK